MSQQVSRIFLNILADLNVLVWLVSIRPLISKLFEDPSKQANYN